MPKGDKNPRAFRRAVCYACTLMSQEWNIRSRGHACSVCGQAFSNQQPCVSVLREHPDSFERRDYHTLCWRDETRDWRPYSLWEGEYEAPVVVIKEEPVKKDTAESLLRRLILMEEPAMRNVVYVLAVMLERGKQLVERDAKPHESGGILRVYEHKKTADIFTVLDPRLRMDEIGTVQQQVVALLSGTHHLEEGAAVPPTAEQAAPQVRTAE
ncbi:MAG: hypothetical protein WCI17_09735 [bacterium]